MTSKCAAPMLSLILFAPTPVAAHSHSHSHSHAHAHAAPRPADAADEAINAVYGDLVRARAAGDVAGMVAPFPADAILMDSRPGPAMGGGPELDGSR